MAAVLLVLMLGTVLVWQQSGSMLNGAAQQTAHESAPPAEAATQERAAPTKPADEAGLLPLAEESGWPYNELAAAASTGTDQLIDLYTYTMTLADTLRASLGWASGLVQANKLAVATMPVPKLPKIDNTANPTNRARSGNLAYAEEAPEAYSG